MRTHLLKAVIKASGWLDDARKRESLRELLARRAGESRPLQSDGAQAPSS